MLGATIVGALLAGSYGVLHDQITYSIGPEYFTRFKFTQFNWANHGFSDRTFVACIGFLATWWVGLVIAWILARRLIPNQARRIAYRNIGRGFFVVAVVGILSGMTGYCYGLYRGPDADYSAWQGNFDELGITQKWQFVRVAYITTSAILEPWLG